MPLPVRLTSLLFIIGFAAATAHAQPALPVEKVVLLTSGVGYFQHEGRISGSGTLELPFRAAQIDDVLKSLVLQDLGGGRVDAVVYPSQDPLNRTLRSYGVDLSGSPSLGQVLHQLRGARVRVTTATGTTAGTILSVEQQQGDVGTRWLLALFDAGTVRSFDLAILDRLVFESAALQAEFEKALTALAQARNQDRKPLLVHYSGNGTRRLRLAYVVEAPVWKASYRLVLPEGGEDSAYLQGWGIVENQTESDWESITLSLASGRPVSFIQHLYEPQYVQRPIVALPTGQALAPPSYEEGVTTSALHGKASGADNLDEVAAADATPSRRLAFTVEAPGYVDPSQSVVAQATGTATGALFEYTVPNVTLPRQRSAMIPIVTETIDAERLSIYNAATHATHPMHGARLTNTTALVLAPGPVTVFDANAYAGDAQLPTLPPGDTRLLAFALDTDVDVQTTRDRQATRLETVRISNGVLELGRRLRIEQTYTVSNEDDRARTLLIEHPKTPDYELVEPPEPVETTDRLYRFRLDVPAGATTVFATREHIVLDERIVLLNQGADLLLSYAANGEIDADVRQALRRAAELRQALQRTDEQLGDVRRRQTQITDEQNRIRENMRTVQPDTDYYRRLLEKLEAQEDELERLQERADALQAERARQQRALTDYLEGLDMR